MKRWMTEAAKRGDRKRKRAKYHSNPGYKANQIQKATERKKVHGYDNSYFQSNKGLYAFYCACRYARKLKATPKWLTKVHKAEMKFIYFTCQLLSKLLGIEYNVDHIVPLKGKLVSGLHVPWNLRIITALNNRRKLNKLLEITQ